MAKLRISMTESDIQEILAENDRMRNALYDISFLQHSAACVRVACSCHVSLSRKALGLHRRCRVVQGTDSTQFRAKQCVLPDGHDGEHIVGGISTI